jgi:phosphatidylglycerol:prolipoprotein diacylglycerol transferase
MGTKALGGPKPKGEIFSYFLILTGVARFLVEFIRINPRVLYGLTNAQIVSLVSIVLGIGLLLWIRLGAGKSAEAA